MTRRMIKATAMGKMTQGLFLTIVKGKMTMMLIRRVRNLVLRIHQVTMKKSRNLMMKRIRKVEAKKRRKKAQLLNLRNV